MFVNQIKKKNLLQALQAWVQCDTSRHYHSRMRHLHIYSFHDSGLFFMRYIPVIKLIKLGRKKKDIYFLFESPKSPYLTYISILVKSSEQSPCKRAIIDILVFCQGLPIISLYPRLQTLHNAFIANLNVCLLICVLMMSSGVSYCIS